MKYLSAWSGEVFAHGLSIMFRVMIRLIRDRIRDPQDTLGPKNILLGWNALECHQSYHKHSKIKHGKKEKFESGSFLGCNFFPKTYQNGQIRERIRKIFQDLIEA